MRHKPLVIGFLVVAVPLTAFMLGYRMGSGSKPAIVFADAPFADITQVVTVGTVVGARIILPTPSPIPVTELNNNQSKVAASDSLGAVEQSLWDVINEFRRQNGLANFKRDEILCAFASDRLKQLHRRGELDGHAGFDEVVGKYLSQDSFTQISEGIAAGYFSPVQIVLTGWAESFSHRAILLSTELDRACAISDGTFAVLIAGRKI